MKKTLITIALIASFAAHAETEMTVTTLSKHIMHGVDKRSELNPMPTAQFKAKDIIKLEDIYKNRVYKTHEDEKMESALKTMYAAIHLTMETSVSAESVLIQGSIGKILYSMDGGGYQDAKDITTTGQGEVVLPKDGKPHNLNIIIRFKDVAFSQDSSDIMVKVLNGDSKAIDWPYQITGGEKAKVDISGYEYGYIKQTYTERAQNTYKSVSFDLPNDASKASFAAMNTTKTVMNQGLNLMETDLNGQYDNETGHWLDFGLVVETPGIVRLLASRSGAKGLKHDNSESGSFFITEDKKRGIYSKLQIMPFGEGKDNGYVYFFYAKNPGIYAMRFLPKTRVSKLQVIMPGESIARPFKPEDTVIKAKAANAVFNATEAVAGGAGLPGLFVINTPVEKVKNGAFSIGANTQHQENKEAFEIKGFYPPKSNEVLP